MSRRSRQPSGRARIMPDSAPLGSSHLQVEIFQNALQRSGLDLLSGMAGHARDLWAENNPSVARFLYKRAAMFPQPPPQFACRHNLMVTICGYSVNPSQGRRAESISAISAGDK